MPGRIPYRDPREQYPPEAAGLPGSPIIIEGAGGFGEGGYEAGNQTAYIPAAGQPIYQQGINPRAVSYMNQISERDAQMNQSLMAQQQEAAASKKAYFEKLLGKDFVIAYEANKAAGLSPQETYDRAWKYKTEQDRFRMQLALKQKGEVSTGVIPNPNPNLTGMDVLANYTPQVQALAKKLVKAEIPYPSAFALKDPLWKTVIQAANDIDPTFNAANYQVRTKTRQSFTSGADSKNITSINTLVGHLATLANRAKELDNSAYPWWNTAANWASVQTGSPVVKNFNTALGAVESELASVFKQTGATDQEIKAWRERISAADSPEQLHGEIAQAVDLMASRLQALKDKYAAGMGSVGTGDFQILRESSRNKLRELGLDPDLIEPTQNNMSNISEQQSTQQPQSVQGGSPPPPPPGQKWQHNADKSQWRLVPVQ